MDRYTGFDFSKITLEDCLNLYENYGGFVFINDGKIVTLVRGE